MKSGCAGAVTDSYDYDAFGNKINSTGTTPNNYLYRGEQYDSDLGLYYLRVRYYNPSTGRFMSRDPNEGFRWLPTTLHKYLYAGGDPVNLTDPSGKDEVEFALRTEEAVPMARVVDIYGCFAGVAFAAVSLDLAKGDPDWRTGVGAAGATFGCVSLYFPEASANAVVQGIIEWTPKVNYAFCGFAIEALVHDLNEVAEGKENSAVAVSDAFGALTGCVGARLSTLIKTP